MRRPGFRALSVALVAVALCACAKRTHEPPSPAVSVKIAPVVAGPVSQSSEYACVVRARDSAVVSPQVSGYVKEIFVRSGDRVAKGTPLVQLDPQRQRATYASSAAAAESAKAGLEGARSTLVETAATRASKIANLRLAERQHECSRQLLADGTIAQAEFDQTKATLDAARAEAVAAAADILTRQAALVAAEKSVAQARGVAESQSVELGYYRIVAPLQGTVGDVPVRVGDLVTPSTRLTTVDRNDVLEAYVPVPAERARDVHEGQVVLLADSNDKTLATTRVFFVSPNVDEESQTVLVKTRVEGEALGAIRASEALRARVIWSTARGLRVPMTAVTRINGQPHVFVVVGEPPVARERVVTLGEIEDNLVVVEKGLAEGDQVVTAGVQKLRDGTRVERAP